MITMHRAAKLQTCNNRLSCNIHAVPAWTLLLLIQTYVFQLSGAQELCDGITTKLVCDDHNPAVFHICLGSNNYPMVCPGTLHFNEETQKCDWPETVNCVTDSLSRKSANATTSAESQLNEDIVSLKSRPSYLNVDAKTVLSKTTITNNTGISRQGSEVSGQKVIDNIITLPGGRKSAEGYQNRLQSNQVSYKSEPYRTAYHQRHVPDTQRDLQTKYKKRKDPMLSPYMKMNIVAKLEESLHKSARPSHHDRILRVSAWHQTPTPAYSSAADHYRRVLLHNKKGGAKRKSASPFQSPNKLSEISVSYNNQLKSNPPNEHSYKNYLSGNSTFALHPSVPSVLHTTSNKQSQQFNPSRTHQHGHNHFPRGWRSAIRRFSPRRTQEKTSPHKFSAQVSPYLKSSWSRSSHELRNLTKDKRGETQHTISNDNSKTPSKYVGSHVKRPYFQSGRREVVSDSRPSSSHVKRPWWTPAKLVPSPTPDILNPTSSPNRKVHKWHKPVEVKSVAKSSKHALLAVTNDQKLSRSPNKQKYKPKTYAAKSGYNIRSPFAPATTSKRLASDLTRKKYRRPSASVSKSSARHATINSPASSSGSKRPRHKINAAAASDGKPESEKSQDKLKKTVELDSRSGDDTEEEVISVYKSPMEKYQTKAGKCSSSWCKLPACRCIGSDIPGGLEAKDIPQMVMLTFDDSITSLNMHYYKELFSGEIKNPNGCPIKSTFFVSGDNSNYDLVKKLHKQGHEIASHTLSHRSPTTWWADAGYDNWEHEIVGMRDRLNEKAGVPKKEITGMRAPFLQVGGDGQYTMLKENKFRYDSSMVTGYLYANNQHPIWPFTLDTPPDSTTCNIPPCPTHSYPGLLEVPLVRWYGSNTIACAMPDACTTDSGRKGSRRFIEENFNRHYTTNRAPFGIFIHAAWFSRVDGSFKGLKDFLKSLADKEDVWVVTLNQALDWVQRPVRLSALSALDTWAC